MNTVAFLFDAAGNELDRGNEQRQQQCRFLCIRIGRTAERIFPVGPVAGLCVDGTVLRIAVDFDVSAAIDGDFDNDGDYECDDVDALTTAVATGGSVGPVRLVGRRHADLGGSLMRRESKPVVLNLGAGRVYLPGDANLSRFVGTAPTSGSSGTPTGLPRPWVGAWVTSMRIGSWTAPIFGIWNTFKFMSSDASLGSMARTPPCRMGTSSAREDRRSAGSAVAELTPRLERVSTALPGQNSGLPVASSRWAAEEELTQLRRYELRVDTVFLELEEEFLFV